LSQEPGARQEKETEMSTTAHPTPATSATVVEPVAPRPVSRAGVAIAVGVGVTAVALALPDVTGDAGSMTHYMGLLAANQPWNLLMFMAIPVILAETLAVSELAVLFRQGDVPRWVHLLNRWAGLLVGPWFLGITVYLTKNAVLPLTSGGAWHGPADLIAVGAYLAGVIPLVGITLIELGILGRGTARARMRLHAIFVGVFLVAAHIAMIFGMLDPAHLGWTPAHTMPTGETMPGMGM
jgi:hypothetical protein